jgi:hypothetical protein
LKVKLKLIVDVMAVLLTSVDGGAQNRRAVINEHITAVARCRGLSTRLIASLEKDSTVDMVKDKFVAETAQYDDKNGNTKTEIRYCPRCPKEE